MWSTLRKRSTALVRAYSTPTGPNEQLIQALTRYMQEEKDAASSNSYKVRAYSKAIDAIVKLPERVRSVDEVRHLDGIGARIAKRIDASLSGTPYEPPTPSRSRKAASAQERSGSKPKKTLDELCRRQVVSSLTSVSGIGSLKANALYDAGCRSFQDLRMPKFAQMMSRPQRINAQYMVGLDHVTREQASTVRDFVAQNIPSKFTVLLGGEFRRGANSAQQIILVVLHPQDTGIFPPQGSPSMDSTIKLKANYHVIPSPFASHPENKVKFAGLPDTAAFSTEIISPLECRGLLAATLTAGTQKWEGIVRVPQRTETETEGNWWETREQRTRGVQTCQGSFFSAEIYYVPRRCAGAALISLTGDLRFNLAIRRTASRLGLRLTEHGLWRWRDMAETACVDGIEKQWSVEQHDGHWELIAGEKEEDIFEAVNMEWVAPERRNFSNLDGRSRKRKIEEDL